MLEGKFKNFMTFDEEKEKLRLSKERKSNLYEDRLKNE